MYDSFYKPDYQSEIQNNKTLICKYWYGSYVNFGLEITSLVTSEKRSNFKIKKRHLSIKCAIDNISLMSKGIKLIEIH